MPEDGKNSLLKDVLGDADPLSKSKVEVVQHDDNHIEKLLHNFDNVQDVILDRFKEDRDQIEKVIKHLEQRVYSMNKPPNVMVEQLVSAVRAKIDQTIGTARILDAYAKIMSAAKNTTLIQNNTTVDATELNKLLSKPAFPDED